MKILFQIIVAVIIGTLIASLCAAALTSLTSFALRHDRAKLSPRRIQHAETPLQTANAPSLAVAILTRGKPRSGVSSRRRPVPEGSPECSRSAAMTAARVFAGQSDTAARAAKAAGLRFSVSSP